MCRIFKDGIHVTDNRYVAKHVCCTKCYLDVIRNLKVIITSSIVNRENKMMCITIINTDYCVCHKVKTHHFKDCYLLTITKRSDIQRYKQALITKVVIQTKLSLVSHFDCTLNQN